MLGRSHAIIGGVSTAVFLITTGTNLIQHTGIFAAAWTVGTIASLLPDLDSPDTTVRTTFGVGSRQSWQELRQGHRKDLVDRGVDVGQWSIARLLDIIHIALPHRGPSHWGITWLGLTFALALACRAFLLPDQLWQAFMVGYASHLVADGVTRAGVKFFAPFYKRPIHLLPRRLTIRTGSDQEFWMMCLFLAILGLYFALFFGYI